MIPPTGCWSVLPEHEEDLARSAGFLKTTSVTRTASEEPVHRRFQHRLPWLLLGLGGALLAADLVGAFEAHLQLNVMLAFSSQASSYLADAVRTRRKRWSCAACLSEFPCAEWSRGLLAGILIGVALAAVALPFVSWRWNDGGLALSVGVSVFAACSTATLAAMMLPWLFDAFASDPAFGSGTLATIIQDLLSIWIYLSSRARDVVDDESSASLHAQEDGSEFFPMIGVPSPMAYRRRRGWQFVARPPHDVEMIDDGFESAWFNKLKIETALPTEIHVVGASSERRGEIQPCAGARLTDAAAT